MTFHLEVVGCRFCQANVADLKDQQAEAQSGAENRRPSISSRVPATCDGKNERKKHWKLAPMARQEPRGLEAHPSLFGRGDYAKVPSRKRKKSQKDSDGVIVAPPESIDDTGIRFR